ncbi:uncharacterized protein LOC131855736 [Achroia grisella]|uniref:uncharacterized protein LOC131855736 n=1 Tax=Achroia grisella TaxID=688607 RepID=UPI0027D29128|nr:uncharacterized protein LOC131855736 [Achroia grisella]
MEDDNDVTITGVTDMEALIHIPDDKPLMQLFKRLIGNDTKQNTVLTNAQILDILKKELNTDVVYIHDLELEIYLNIIKKFLKDWPQWDDFDKSVSSLKSKGDIDAIKKLLDVKYNNFRDYLKAKLDVAQPLIKNVVKKATAKKKEADDDKMNVLMEVSCTRSQLNKIFFRRPNPQQRNTIFNFIDGPTKIVLDNISIEALINWFHIKVEVNLPSFVYRFGMTHKLKHVLLNKKINETAVAPTVLNQHLQRSTNRKNASLLKLEDIQYILKEILASIPHDYHNGQLIRATLAYIETHLVRNHKSGGLYLTYYRKYMNKYAYVRYLYADVPSDSNFNNINKYDLQLQEMIYPSYYYEIGKFVKSEIISKLFIYTNWIKFECLLCNKVFLGPDMTEKLKQHILDYHFDQPDWQCTNCKSIYSMLYLAENKWEHKC